MIRFCDREVFTITKAEFDKMTKSQLLTHFYDNYGEYEDSAVFIYDDDNQYYGMTDKKAIMLKTDYVIRKYFTISDNFWDEAKDFFVRNPDIAIPVFDSDKQPLGFCYSDNKSYDTYEMILNVFERVGENIASPLTDLHKNIGLICINDLNGLAWRVWRLLTKLGYQVCTIGEQWEWFGVKTMVGYNEYPAYARMNIYAEGRGMFRERDIAAAANVSAEFNWLISWIYNNESILYEAEIGRLLEKGIEVLKVVIPDMNRLDKNVFTKTDLLNQIEPVPVGRVSNNEAVRNRQRDYLGDAEYEVKEKTGKGILSDYGWSAVAYTKLKTEKMSGVSYDKRIYLVGPCMVASYDSLTENSLVARLQEFVGRHGYEVVRVQVPDLRMDLICEIQNIPVRNRDIVVLINGDIILKKTGICFEVDLSELYNKPRTVTWFKDRVSRHVNSAANREIAREIYDKYLRERILSADTAAPNNKYLQKGEILSDELQQEIFSYTDSIRKCNVKADAGIGSIVMNCNPFTNGHRYLIENAAAQVDLLYIFVVQEDKSYFPFEERFELVKAGTAHLHNVAVVPSGEYVLSYKTLPMYFEKEEKKTAAIDATHDIELFARYIAPRLGITYRFAGEEPLDMVTRQYNEQMSALLPEFGIEFVEIPRKTTEADNEVISASRVRKLIGEERWKEIRALVPDTTYEYIMRKYADRAAR